MERVMVGTAVFLVTMLVLGFAVLQELVHVTNRNEAQQSQAIEAGALVYDAHCATCHGVNGKAETCFDSEGRSISCEGLPLNNFYFFCDRVNDLDWNGTLEQFVESSVVFGRDGAEMQTSPHQNRGELRDSQIQDVTLFILNWEEEVHCQTIPEPVWSGSAEEFQILDEIEKGDAVLGEIAYTMYACDTCHGDLDNPESAMVGPWLGDIKSAGGNRVEGMNAQEYIYESILDTNAFIPPECPYGPCANPSLMPSDFIFRMSLNTQDMADLLAYLMGDEYVYP